MDVERWLEAQHSADHGEEVVLRGGKPWGFSLQGGCESRAPLTISKVDPYGKAAGQLQVGDTVLSVNGGPCRSLVQAVQLVQKTDYCLNLCITRGKTHDCESVKNGKYNTTYQQDIVPDLDNKHISGASAFSHLKTGSKSRKSDSFLIGNPSRPSSWHPPVNPKEKLLPWQQQTTDQSPETSVMKSSHVPTMPWQTSVAPSGGMPSLKSYASYNNVYSLQPSSTATQRHTVLDSNTQQPAMSSWGGLSNSKSVSSLQSGASAQSPSHPKPGSVYANLSRELGIPFSPQSRGQEEEASDERGYLRASSGNNSSSNQRMDLKHSRSMGDVKQELHPPVQSKEFVKPEYPRRSSGDRYSPISMLNAASQGFKPIANDANSICDDGERPPAPPARDASSLRFSSMGSTFSTHSRTSSWSVSSRHGDRSTGQDNNNMSSISTTSVGSDSKPLSNDFSSITNTRDHSSIESKPRIKSWDCNPSQTYELRNSHLSMKNTANFGNQSSNIKTNNDRPSGSHEEPFKTDTLHKAKVAKVCPSEENRALSEQNKSLHGDYNLSTQRHSSTHTPVDVASSQRHFSSTSPSDNVPSDVHLRGSYMQTGYTYPKYDHESGQHDSKNYHIPSSKEQNFQSSISKSHLREEKSSSLHNEMPHGTNKLDDLLQRCAAEIKHDSEQLKSLNSNHHQRFDSDISTPRHSTASSDISVPWHSATSSMSSGDSGPRTSYSVVRSPKNFASQHQVQSQSTQMSSGYSYTNKSKPFYNTSTQTDSVIDDVSPQGIQGGNLKNAEVQVDDDFHSRNSSSSSQFSPSPHRLTSGSYSNQFSFNEEDLGQMHGTEPQSYNRDAGHRVAPVVEMLQNEQRIPQTITEEERSKKELNVTNDIIAPLNEYSSNEAPLLRKLSMEFYGSDRFGGSYTRLDNISRRDVPPIPEEKDTKSYAKYPTAWSNKNYEDIGQAPVLNNADKFQNSRSYLDKKNESSRNDKMSAHDPVISSKNDAHKYEPSDYKNAESIVMSEDNRDQNALTKNEEKRQSKRRQSRGRRSEGRNPANNDYEEIVWSNDTSPMPPTLSSSDPPLRRNKQVSLRKAYGIFDEVESYGEKRSLVKHGKSASTSHVAMHSSKEAKGSKAGYKPENASHANSKDSSNYFDLKKTSQKLFGSSENIAKNKPQKSQNGEKKLRRTSSEQFRPIKERLKSDDNDKHKTSDPDSSNSDSKNQLSNLAKSELQKPQQRYSESDEVFQKGISRLQISDDKHARSKSESGKHKNSDPELKKAQAQAVMSFFEMKTGKRLSSVSVTSDASSMITSDIGSAVSSDDSAVLRDVSFDDTFQNNLKREAMTKSKSMPRDLRLPSSDSNPSPTNKSGSVTFEPKISPLADLTRPRSQSSGDSLSPGSNQRDHMWDFSREKRRSASVGKDDSDWSTSRPTIHIPQSSLITAQSSSSMNQTVESGYYGDQEAEKQALRRSIDYSSSSSGSPSPTKTGVDFHRQYGYQVTYNESYKSGDEEEAPPTLPPRNYKHGKPPASPNKSSPGVGNSNQSPSDKSNKPQDKGQRSNKTTPEQSKPTEMLQMGLQAGYKETNLDQVFKMKQQQLNSNFENSPNYADQLRQQSRKISQSQQPMINAARYQSKPVFEPKVSISMSQPVKKQPSPQEAHPAPPGDHFSNSKTADGLNEQINPQSKTMVTSSSQMAAPLTKASLQSLPAPQTHAAKSRRHSHHQYQQPAPSIKEEKSRRISHHLLLRPDLDEKRQTVITTPAQADFAKSRALSAGSQDLTRTAILESPETGKASDGGNISSSQKSPNVESADTSLEDNVYEEMNVMSNVSSGQQLRASPRSHDRSQGSSPELPLPPPPKELQTRVEFSPHSTPLPPPPPSAAFYGANEETNKESRKRLVMKDVNELSPYSKDSYMHFKTQSQPNRRVYGSYQRRSDTSVASPPTSPTLSPYSASSLQNEGKPSAGGNVNMASQSHTQIPSPAPPESGPEHVYATVNAGVRAEKSSLSTVNSYQQSGPSSSRPSSAASGKSKLFDSNKTDHRSQQKETSIGSYHFGQANVTLGYQYKKESQDSSPSMKVADIKASLLRRSNENLLDLRSRKSPVNVGSHLSHSRENIQSSFSTNSRDNVESPVNQSTVDCTQESVSTQNSHTFVSSKVDSHARYGSTDSSRSDPSYDRVEKSKSNNGTESKKKNVSDPMMGSGSAPAVINGEQGKSKAMKDDLNNIKIQSDIEIPVVCHHKRQKSQEEIDYEEHAAILASKLKDEDRALSDVIYPPLEFKSSTDYMDDLFKSDSFTSPSRSPQHKSNDSLNSSDLKNQTSPQPSWSSSKEHAADLSSLTRQKEELINRLKKKLEILQEEKETLQGEIKDNNDLGKKIGEVVEQKSDNKTHVEKFHLLVDELDKVLHLLLMLSGRLAKEENAVLCLPESTDTKTKDLRVSKCEELRGKLNDAKSLKEGIDRRSNTVAKFLLSYLNEEEMNDYQHFVNMKTKLKMDLQEINDKIVMGKDQLTALEKSISSS